MLLRSKSQRKAMANSIWVFFSTLLCIVILSSKSCLALYEDQVGVMDWHKKYIGNVKEAVFHTQKTGRRRVIVATEENVIASLDLRKGDLFWRHVLAESDAVDGIDIALGKYVITLSSNASILRAWSLADGQMVWESHLKGSVPSRSLLSMPVAIKVEKDSAVLAFSGGWLHAVSSIDGEILWRTELFLEGLEIQRISVSPSGGTILAVGFDGYSQLVLCQISATNGEIIKWTTESVPGGIFGEASFISSDKLVVLDGSRSTIVSAGFSDGKIKFRQTALSNLVDYYSGDLTILPAKLVGVFALRSESFIFLVKASNEDELVIIDKVKNPACVSDSLLLTEGQQAFAVIQQEDDKVSLRVKLDSGEQTELIKDNIRIDNQKGLVQKVFINNYIRTDKSYGFRALITMEDHSLLLLQQGEIVWSREEGLASIMDTTTSELPVEKEGVSVAKVEENLFEWLKGHMLKLKGTLMLASPEDIAVIQDMRLRSSEKSKMTRDHNGFRKLIIVITKAGKVFALHSGDGRVVWSLLLPSLRKTEACQHPSGFKIYNWQTPHHHAMDTNPSILVVGSCRPDASSLSFVDSYTGKEIKSLNLPYSILQVVPLSLTDSTEQRLHLLIDTNKQAHLFPRSTDSLSKLEGERQNIYLYSVDTEKQIIMGHTLGGNCISDAADEYCFDTRHLWSVIFPSETEVIAKIATRMPNEAVHTQAKILGDQDVMYKYISKNLLFVVTVSPKASGRIGSCTPDEAWLVAYLIDTVTGRILHRVTHLGAQGPVNAVFSENWVVYHYFNLRAHRYEISVMEIYDESRADNKDVLRLMFGKHNLTVPISSYSRPEVTVKAQSYFFTHSVKTMAVTATVKGITSKQLLIGTISDQVLALDKRFLDPRRTPDPSPSEREEGIIPLTDALPIFPQSYITHSLQVEGLRGIVTVPSRLESTALVFTYGVDVFFTRIAPSRTYDSLTEDFSYALLLITIVALVGAIIATWILSEKKELREKWR
ncbi:uncharacterized protein LOC116265081 [Nymphaea colorata]|nr:uncharacterized protein LOC116265081 [Nymphaea colorata]